MPYNIEDEEEYLKHNSPYEINDAKWQAMQQRIKANVLGENKPKAKKIKFTYWKITAAAIGLLFIIGTCFTYWPATKTVQTEMAYNKADNPEKQLDAAILNLNDSELDYFQELYENDVTNLNDLYNE